MDDSTNSPSATPPPITPVAPPPPPPVFAPPPVMPAPAPKPKSGGGWKVLAIILMVFFALFVLYKIGSFFTGLVEGAEGAASHGGGPRLIEVVRENNHATDKIAVIEVSGIIMSGVDGGGYDLVDVIAAQLKRAEKDEHVKAVILKVDSPGGEVLASDEIYRAILDFQTMSSKPVIASMGSLAASGGYYISVPCEWIVANELTITGSIGVIMSSYNYRGLMDKVGLKPQVYKSGKFKDMLSGSRNPEDTTTEEREMIQNLINETYGRFKEVVAEGRSGAAKRNGGKGKKLADNWADFADGRVMSGKEALQRGFVDELGNFRVAVDRAKSLASLKDANLVHYAQEFDLADFFKIFGKSEAKLKIDVGMDMPKLPAGRLYFISPTFVN